LGAAPASIEKAWSSRRGGSGTSPTATATTNPACAPLGSTTFPRSSSAADSSWLRVLEAVTTPSSSTANQSVSPSVTTKVSSSPSMSLADRDPTVDPLPSPSSTETRKSLAVGASFTGARSIAIVPEAMATPSVTSYTKESAPL
jgi:hypothetical protein